MEKDAIELGEDVDAYIFKEMDTARKNTTQKYLRLFRLILRL